MGTDDMTPRLTVRDEADATLIVNSLAAFCHAKITDMSEQAARYKSVGRHDMERSTLEAMVTFTEQATGLITAAKTESLRHIAPSK